ncbi:MAG: secretion protein Por [Fibrobacter sp.]|nr:secretion protein Por [Fibrobacter sp.]
MRFDRFFPVLLCVSVINSAFAQNVSITVNAAQDKKAVSPYLYGRNNTFDKPASFYQDAGLRFVRMNGGNNATKYNWRKKISSHPDWYNNVYLNDWDKISQQIAADHPDMQAMWAFQLLGRVASSTDHNFNDWEYNQSEYWEGIGQNLAGGGVPNTENPKEGALVEGDASLYTQPWPADSSVAILDHWFGPGGLGLNKNQFLYWSMDNEPDIWDGTHDDVMLSGLIPVSEFMNRFIDLAKKARAKFPEIKICGPVTTSEWQWFRWGDEDITIDGKYFCFLEYFIKRCADEEKATGIRVLDVVDLHNYPYFPSNEAALQLHRAYYDETYDYPGANGIKTINGGWDNSQTKEYIFKRINNWLDQHFGANHGITLALSEWSPGPSEPNLASVIYASHLGLFGNNGIDFFTPWTWFTGMWETLHLFSRYAKNYSVATASTLENTVSAYTTVNESVDSMTVIVVNRDMNSVRNVTVNLNGFSIPDGNYKTLQLSSLPETETFVSHSQNALKENQITVSSNAFTIQVPALSIIAVILSRSTSTSQAAYTAQRSAVNVNCARSFLKVKFTVPRSGFTYLNLCNLNGTVVKSNVFPAHAGEACSKPIDLTDTPNGFYILKIENDGNIISSSKVVVTR